MIIVIWKIFTFLVVIGALVFVHEFGHFIIAKLCRVGVLKFSVGFGPTIFKKKVGETTYQIGIIPLGGFVRMLGDMPDMITGEQETDSLVRVVGEADYKSLSSKEQELLNDRSRWFIEKPLLHRSAIVAAGPIFNFAFSIIAIFFSILIYGEIHFDDQPIISQIDKGSPAAIVGVQANDRVTKVDGVSIETWSELAEKIFFSKGKELVLDVERGSELLSFKIKPKKINSGYRVGIARQVNEERKESTVFRAAQMSVVWTARISILTLDGLWGMLTGQISPENLGGPKLIFDEAGKHADKGFESFLRFLAFLSVTLAVLNLLPIPVLDGGHLLFFLYEAIFGPIQVRKKEFAQQVGMLFLLLLMVYAIRNDFTREPIEDTPKEVDWSAAE